jgi:glutamine amidotransferase
MIAIIDYGRGNLTSVSNAFARIGVEAVVTSDKRNITAADAVVLPGVGEFSDAMATLAAGKLDRAILDAIAAGKPFLGICLGYQMLFEYSEEGGNRLPGLGIFKGAVRRFPDTAEMSGLKIPHMGWNKIDFTGSGLFDRLPASGAFMYFVHSYYPDPVDRSIVAAETDYGIRFASAVSNGNVHGMQFHPEKSGDAGLTVLRNFAGGSKC